LLRNMVCNSACGRAAQQAARAGQKQQSTADE
jgi:hypothetical protein